MWKGGNIKLIFNVYNKLLKKNIKILKLKKTNWQILLNN